MKYPLFLLTAFFCLNLPAQTTLRVTGKVTNPTGEAVGVIYETNPLDYKLREKAEGILNQDGTFSLEVPLTAERELILQHGREQSRFFAGPGDSLHITLDADQFDETLRYDGRGAGVGASNFLAQWFLTYEDESAQRTSFEQIKELDPVDYQAWRKGHYEAQQAFVTEMADKYALSEAFVNHFHTSLTYDWAGDLMIYPAYHAYLNRMETDPVLPAEYYDFLDQVALQAPGALAVNAYPQFIQSYLTHATPVPEGAEAASALDKYAFAGEILTGEPLALVQGLLLKSVMEYGNVNTIAELYAAYVEAATVPAYVQALAPLYDQALRMAPGQPAPDFTAVDPDGKAVALSDLKGKVVYMDFWASWCGPCRREMPASRELQERFADEKDVVFLYVSIDDSEAAWRQAMEQEQLGGVHLFSQGWQSAAPVAYGVEGIPSYFLIHKDGTIANAHAPRPSAGEALDAEIRAALSHGQPVQDSER